MSDPDSILPAATPNWSLRGVADDARAGLVMAMRQVMPLRRVLATLLVVAAVGIGALFVLGLLTNTPMALLTRDVAATAGVKFYIGILSSLGALTWCAGASVCWFAAAALRGVACLREPARFLASAGALQTALGADDFFMLHEVVYPKFGLHEEVLVVFYGLALLVLLLRFRRQLLDSELLLFLIGALVAVMLPATTSHWVGGRLRFPIDLLFMPVAAVFLDVLWTRLLRLCSAAEAYR